MTAGHVTVSTVNDPSWSDKLEKGNSGKRTEVAQLWTVVAKVRAARGDTAGAARARRAARTYRDINDLGTPSGRARLLCKQAKP